MRTLFSRTNLTRKPACEALKAALSDHFVTQPLLLAQRYRFHKPEQKEGETVVQFIAELRSLARSCEFDNALQSSLRDRFVCGLRDTATVTKLITVRNLSLDDAVQQAYGLESTVHETSQVRSLVTSVMKHNVPVNAVGQGARRSVRKFSSTSQEVACVHCGNSEHTPDKCLFRDAECHHCNKHGHLRRVCIKRLAEKKEIPGKQTTVSASRGVRSSQRLHAVEDLTDHATSSDDLFVGVNSLKATCATLSARPDNPLVVEP